jgi:hypothetical protein
MPRKIFSDLLPWPSGLFAGFQAQTNAQSSDRFGEMTRERGNSIWDNLDFILTCGENDDS